MDFMIPKTITVMDRHINKVNSFKPKDESFLLSKFSELV
ncbi:hypothetical protein NSP_36780 [Nodularia spumigena CCY9414]|nr:hypothetical protein NSP_36780 [Nodularia spumigena CCY9414]